MEWITATQETMGKLIQKPKMTEKYLKKPPFRFLHDAIMEVTRQTGFAQGLYNADESDAQALGDKQAKIEFLNKAINVTCFATGEKIDVSANKIVAGLEAEKTNAWLQKLASAASTGNTAKSEEAVARVLNGESMAAPKKKEKERKEKKVEEEPAAAAPPADDGAAAAAAVDPEAAARKEKEERRAERKRREEAKRAKEEAAAAAAAAPPAGGEADQPPPAEEATEEQKKKEEREERRRRKKEKEEAAKRQAEEEAAAAEHQRLEEQRLQAEAAAAAADAERLEEERRAQEAAAQAEASPSPSVPGTAAQATRPMGEDFQQAGEDDAGGMTRQMPMMERPRTAGRKPPPVTSKVKATQDDEVLVANIEPPMCIQDGADKDDDQDMWEAEGVVPVNAVARVAGDGAQHGKLVREIMEADRERIAQEEKSTRETADDTKEKGIVMGKIKRKSQATTLNFTEIDVVKLGEAIQGLCQAANPLGKSIDLVHQDIANMGKELDKWKLEYREANDQYTRVLKQTDEQLQPMFQKIAELDDKIAEQKAKIRNSR